MEAHGNARQRGLGGYSQPIEGGSITSTSLQRENQQSPKRVSSVKNTNERVKPYCNKSEIPVPSNNELFASILEKLNTMSEELQNIKQTQQKILTKLSSLEEGHNNANDSDDYTLSNNWCALNRTVNKNTDEMTEATLNKTEAHLIRLLPMTTLEQFQEIEEKLLDEKFTSNAKVFFKKMSRDMEFEQVFRRIANDGVYFHYNVDGLCKKLPLIKMKLFDKIIYDCYSGNLLRKEYTSELRKCILKSHNRHNRNKITGKRSANKIQKVDVEEEVSQD